MGAGTKRSITLGARCSSSSLRTIQSVLFFVIRMPYISRR